MARGTVIGEPVVSQANSKAYADSYERMFGKDHKPTRGRWSFGEAEASEKAANAPILAGRFYENTKATDGSDIGSRAKHRAYMKAHDVASSSDYSPEWYAKRRAEKKAAADRERRQTVERLVYTKFKP